MKIRDIIAERETVLSFEVFPPKTSDTFDSVKHATEEIAKLHPSFMSVTYGAAGTSAGYTTAIAENLPAEGCSQLQGGCRRGSFDGGFCPANWRRQVCGRRHGNSAVCGGAVDELNADEI